jgi:hypothetical protein
MLRTNLSTRPFYNERAVHAVAAVIAIAVLAVTAWQVARVVRLSRYKTELHAAIKRDRMETEVHTGQAQQIRRGLDQKQLTVLSASAKEARNLIAQRTFSWTQLFNQIETTLPDDVMLLAVHPKIEDGVTQLSMDVQGKSEEDIESFWNRLEKTGQFHNAEWTSVNVSEQGYHRIAMSVVYTPAQPAVRPAGTGPVKQ